VKFGTKLNHLIKVGAEISDEHEGCAVHVEIHGTIGDYGNINGRHSLTLEKPGETAIHHNVSIDMMIALAGDFKKSLDE